MNSIFISGGSQMDDKRAQGQDGIASCPKKCQPNQPTKPTNHNRPITRREAREVLSIDAQIRAVYEEDRRRKGRGQVGRR
jgi:hypothetical protein